MAANIPRPSRSTLMMPRSAQSSLSHWMTVRPGMVAGSMGHDGVESTTGDDHAAGVLAEVAGQVLDLCEESAELKDPRVRLVEARSREARLEGLLRVHVLETAEVAREPIHVLPRESRGPYPPHGMRCVRGR